MPKSESDCNLARSIVKGTTKKNKSDEIRGEKKTAERLENETCRLRKRIDVGGWFEDICESGGDFDNNVENKRKEFDVHGCGLVMRESWTRSNVLEMSISG